MSKRKKTQKEIKRIVDAVTCKAVREEEEKIIYDCDCCGIQGDTVEDLFCEVIQIDEELDICTGCLRKIEWYLAKRNVKELNDLYGFGGLKDDAETDLF